MNNNYPPNDPRAHDVDMNKVLRASDPSHVLKASDPAYSAEDDLAKASEYFHRNERKWNEERDILVENIRCLENKVNKLQDDNERLSEKLAEKKKLLNSLHASGKMAWKKVGSGISSDPTTIGVNADILRKLVSDSEEESRDLKEGNPQESSTAYYMPIKPTEIEKAILDKLDEIRVTSKTGTQYAYDAYCTALKLRDEKRSGMKMSELRENTFKEKLAIMKPSISADNSSRITKDARMEIFHAIKETDGKVFRSKYKKYLEINRKISEILQSFVSDILKHTTIECRDVEDGEDIPERNEADETTE